MIASVRLCWGSSDNLCGFGWRGRNGHERACSVLRRFAAGLMLGASIHSGLDGRSTLPAPVVKSQVLQSNHWLSENFWLSRRLKNTRSDVRVLAPRRNLFRDPVRRNYFRSFGGFLEHGRFQTMCVRLCDGYYFPISHAASPFAVRPGCASMCFALFVGDAAVRLSDPWGKSCDDAGCFGPGLRAAQETLFSTGKFIRKDAGAARIPGAKKPRRNIGLMRAAMCKTGKSRFTLRGWRAPRVFVRRKTRSVALMVRVSAIASAGTCPTGGFIAGTDRS